MPTLTLDSVCYNIGERRLITDFSYSFTEGKPYILRGQSGVGKTTLLRLIAGLSSPHSGYIEGGGLSAVSFAFQDYRLFPAATALENASVTSDKEKAAEMLISLGFEKQDLQKRPHELSGGMQARVSLARAVLSDRPVLLLDEPTSALDGVLRARVWQIIRAEAERRIVIVVSHESEDAGAFDTVTISL